MLGAPGAGKGTQAAQVAAQHKIPHISTGDIIRAAIKDGSALGQKVKGFVDRGELVPDEVVIDLISERFGKADCAEGFLLDGFPRTIEQARKLDQMLSKAGKTLTHVVNLNVPKQELIDRICRRGQMGSGRSDDDQQTAIRRLQVFLDQTAPLIEFYRSAGKLLEVDGVGAIEEVYRRIALALQG